MMDSEIKRREQERLAFIEGRDGRDGAVAFARQGLFVYREALTQRTKNGKRRGYAQSYRRELVASCIVFRQFLRSKAETWPTTTGARAEKGRHLRCSVCGAAAGRHHQWWNRDDGNGICRACLDFEIAAGMSPDQVHENYGVAGKHYEAKKHIYYGREYTILATFQEGENRAANAYMAKHKDATVLAVDNGRIILASKFDLGKPVKEKTT